MKTIELKNILIHRIAGINDKTFLTAINTIIETKSDSTVYRTTPEQQKKISEGQRQLAKGEYFTHEQVQQDIDKWLKEE